jgi:hypothetical protein
VKQESRTFLKKSTKKRLSLGVYAHRARHAKEQKFFGSFVQKRTSSL